MGVKLTMKHYAPGNSTPVITDYVGGFVYENGELRFFGSPEGRVVKNGSNFEYQYAIADHQGNTRVVFSSATPSVETRATGFESDPGDLENYPSGGNLSDWPLFNRTPGGTHSQLLNGGYSSQVGIAKSFKVYPGDKVRIEAHAKYEDVAGPGNAQGFATALLQAFSLPAPAAGETGTPSHALDTWGGFVDEGIQDDEAAPLAFVNIVIFDKNFDFLDAAWTQINASAKQVGLSPDVPHDELIQEYSIDEEGYVFMYVSNNSPLKVYFDDVTFTHTPTNVIQYNEYYPFGLQTSNSWTRDNNRNDYLYNAGSELNATSEWYETFFRAYDPTLGRFLQVDPLATKYASLTPYSYAVNNPVLLNDPSGADALPDGIPDWLDYRTEMIRRHMNGGAGVTGLQRGRSQERWSNNGNKPEGTSISSEYFGVIANTFNNGGSLSIGENSLHYFYLDLGAKVQIDQDGDPIEGTEFGANTFHFDEIDLAIGHSLGAPPGKSSEYGWDDFFKDGKTGATVMRGLAGVRSIMEKEYVAQATINNAIRGSSAAIPNSLRTISTVSKVAGVGGILASWGIAGYQVVNGTDNTSTWVNAGVNTLIIGAAILGGPITVGIAAGAGIVYGVSYLLYGDEMDAAINDNFGYR